MGDKSGTITIPLYEPSLKYWQGGGVVLPHDMNDVVGVVLPHDMNDVDVDHN